MDRLSTQLVQTVEHGLFLEAFAQRKAPLTLILGSGLSLPANLPSWSSLERTLRQAVDQQMSAANQFGLAFKQSKYSALKSTQGDLWLSFQLAREALGAPVFESIISRELTASSDVEVPEGYTELLKLQPQGIITLNLDRFAGDAMTAHQARMVTPIYGSEISTKWNVIIGDRPHLVYLHGDVQNPSTWVLTRDDLQALLDSRGHTVFLQSVFLSNLVLFVGVSADDVALSMRLLDLRSAGFRPQNLFWLTDRHDVATEEWAERNYVKLIRYQAQKTSEHTACIQSFVKSCLEFSPREIAPPPSENSKYGYSDRINPDELATRSPEDIRKALSSMLAKVISESPEGQLYDDYRTFCNDYDFCVHQAFYKKDHPRFSKWFDYELSFPEIGRGNFGQVFSATSPDGDLVAVKIMNEGIFANNDMLGGFRRGVRSLRIIHDSNLPGVVPMLEAFEIPPTIVMPFVEGVSLQQALERRHDIGWLTKLNMGLKIADIVSSAHALTQTVLHRDLKPSNVMITNFDYTGEFDPEVMVIDFDMSWHKGASEKDVIFESRDDLGFLCPEQTDPSNAYSARSAKVDSYGLGMTLYYMFGMEAPLANEPLSPLWFDKVLKASRKGYNFTWQSAPQRLGRLIVRATQMAQPDRIDFSTIQRELSYIKISVEDRLSLDNVELWAEEVLCQVGSSVGYKWDDIRGSGIIESPNGLRVVVTSDIKNQTVSCAMEFVDAGMTNRSSIPRFLRQSVDSSVHLFKASGWSKVRGEVIQGGLVISAEASLDALKSGQHTLGAPREVFDNLSPN